MPLNVDIGAFVDRLFVNLTKMKGVWKQLIGRTAFKWMNMKMNFKLLTSAIVLGMAIPAALPLVANAADTPADNAKSATVTVTGGTLTITKNGDSKQEAPSFQFEKANVSTEAQTGLKTNGYQNTDATDTYIGSNLSVDDDTGTGNGWHVTAQLGDFSDGASHSLAGAALNVNSASGS